ncbi:MAG TPA: hypothetical protein VE130_13915 [Nitrososphaeraceae archaeon]|jgi:hypothetical protein|nr:hypothetical protein [Nitrososphaeraceae archaeon]
MIQTCYAKYGLVSGLLLCAIVLSITEDSQRLVFAQITPASEKAGGNNDDGSSNSSPETDGGGNNDDGSSDSSSGSSDEEDDSSGNIEDDGMTTSQQAEEANPLLEAITNKVRQELAAVGITDLGF